MKKNATACRKKLTFVHNLYIFIDRGRRLCYTNVVFFAFEMAKRGVYMKYCDLHNHSVCSDGSFTPKELVDYALEKGVSALGLTDHNTIDGIHDFLGYAQEKGIEAVFGSELSTGFGDKEIHLLALFITEKNAHRVKEFTDIQLKAKEDSNIDLSNNLQKAGYKISLEELKKKYGKNINRAHFARELVNGGYAETTDEAFNTLLKSGNGFYNPPKRVTFYEGVELVKSWGCVPVMAHPLLSVTKEELEEILDVATPLGLVGIEVYYPKFNDEEKAYLLSLCQKHSLLPSGGSDYHGNMKSQGDLNEAKAPYECYEKLYAVYKNIK